MVLARRKILYILRERVERRVEGQVRRLREEIHRRVSWLAKNTKMRESVLRKVQKKRKM